MLKLLKIFPVRLYCEDGPLINLSVQAVGVAATQSSPVVRFDVTPGLPITFAGTDDSYQRSMVLMDLPGDLPYRVSFRINYLNLCVIVSARANPLTALIPESGIPRRNCGFTRAVLVTLLQGITSPPTPITVNGEEKSLVKLFKSPRACYLARRCDPR